MTAQDLIDRSLEYDEIATAPYDQEVETELLVLCEDTADNRVTAGELEYWGTTDDGHAWRVHLKLEQA